MMGLIEMAFCHLGDVANSVRLNEQIPPSISKIDPTPEILGKLLGQQIEELKAILKQDNSLSNYAKELKVFCCTAIICYSARWIPSVMRCLVAQVILPFFTPYLNLPSEDPEPEWIGTFVWSCEFTTIYFVKWVGFLTCFNQSSCCRQQATKHSCLG
jgi:hypothetical protein